MVAHFYYNEKLVNQDDNDFSSFSGIDRISIRSKNGQNTISIKEVDKNLVISVNGNIVLTNKVWFILKEYFGY